MSRLKNSIILIGIIIFFILLFIIKIPMPCLFKTWLGISCPSCGITRAVEQIFSANILESFKYNILAIPLIIFVIFTFIYVSVDIIKNTENYIKLIDKVLRKYWIIILIFLIIIMIINNIYKI